MSATTQVEEEKKLLTLMKLGWNYCHADHDFDKQDTLRFSHIRDILEKFCVQKKSIVNSIEIVQIAIGMTGFRKWNFTEQQ